MEKILVGLILLIGLSQAIPGPFTRVIYGEDTRLDYYELSSDLKTMGESTVAIIVGNNVLSRSGNNWVMKPTSKASSVWGWCSSERYADQPIAGNGRSFCSGFLIASDPGLIVTAGHCAEHPLDAYWIIFDFNQNSQSDSQLTFRSDQVYRVSRIVGKGKEFGSSEDWAVFELDRRVTNHKPYTVVNDNVKVGDQLVLIGHPYGLTKKTDPDGEVRAVRTNLIGGYVDSYGGNSGSPVFDKDGALVGILVGGAPDFVRQGGCQVSNVCPGGTSCSSFGENIVPICHVGRQPSISNIGLCTDQNNQQEIIEEVDNSSSTILFSLVLLIGCLLL